MASPVAATTAAAATLLMVVVVSATLMTSADAFGGPSGCHAYVRFDPTGSAGTPYGFLSPFDDMPTSAFSFSFWLRLRSGPVGADHIVTYASTGQADAVKLTTVASSDLTLTINGVTATLDSSGYAEDAWVHIVVTFDTATGISYYKNGVSTTTSGTFGNGVTFADGGCLVVGMEQSGVCSGFTLATALYADLQTFAMWNKALDSTEAAATFNAVPDATNTALVFIWHSEATTAVGWLDSADNLLDLTWDGTTPKPSSIGGSSDGGTTCDYVPECSNSAQDADPFFPAETDVDCGGSCAACACDAAPCQNGGACSNSGSGGYTCDCSGVDYSGTNCETHIDDCSPDPCQNGGVCSDGVRSFTCNCAGTDYSDATCSTFEDGCSPDPCNGGACTDGVDGVDNFSCNCTGTDMMGDTCSAARDDCASSPCDAGQTCFDGFEAHTCSSYFGYSTFSPASSDDRLVHAGPLGGTMATTSLSVGAWMRLHTAGSGVDNTIIDYAATGDVDAMRLVYRAGASGHGSLTLNGNTAQLRGAGLAADTWVYVVATWRSSDGAVALYEDGASAGTATLGAGYSLPAGGCFSVGVDSTDATCTAFAATTLFDGDFIDVSVWSTELSGGAITALMEFANRPDGTETDLVALWSYENMIGSMWSDSSSNNYHLGGDINRDASLPVQTGGQARALVIDPTGSAGTPAATAPAASGFALSAATITAWVSFSAAGAGQAQHIMSYAEGTTLRELVLRVDRSTGNVIMFVGDSSATIASWSPTTGMWYHIAAAWDNGSGDTAFFVNGVEHTTATGLQAGYTTTDGGCIALGHDQGSLCGGFSLASAFYGELSSIAVWSAKFSEADALTRYTNARGITGSEANLVAAWTANRFQSDSGGSTGAWADSGPNGNTLTWNGDTPGASLATRSGAAFVPECFDGATTGSPFTAETDTDCGGLCPSCPCDSTPCDNSGACTNGAGGSFTCDCSAVDYSGTTCQTHTDDCSPDPCQNGGACIDGVNSFTCNCDGTAHTGATCASPNCYAYLKVDPTGSAGFPAGELATFAGMPTTALSMAFWLRLSAPGGAGASNLGVNHIMSYAESNENANEVQFTAVAGQYARFRVGSSRSVDTSGYTQGEWVHVTVTWTSTGGAYTYYKNGALVTSSTGMSSGKTLVANGCLVIGQDQDSLCGGYDLVQALYGELQDFGLWNTVLDGATAAAVYNSRFATPMDGTESGLVLLWLNEGITATGWTDATTNGNDMVWAADTPKPYGVGGDPDGNLVCTLAPECTNGVVDAGFFPGETGLDCGGFCTSSCPCDASPCLNGGSCSNDGGNNYTCDCAGTDHTGTHCEMRVDNCSPDPCMNGAVCIDGVDGSNSEYMCNCTGTDYTGTNCTMGPTDNCVGNACQNDGVCMDGVESYTCQCTDYSGEFCETGPIDQCAGHSLCQNGADCVDGNGEFTCDCHGTDMEGQFCEIGPIDHCPYPYNGTAICSPGSCTDAIDGFLCDCTGTDYGGITCDAGPIDNCASHTCQNGGSCVDGVDGATPDHTCDCSSVDYEGSLCQTGPIDHCARAPWNTTCQNGGTCVDGINTATCSCPSNWGGADCSVARNYCNDVSPCQNGGSCSNGATYGDYTCDCSAIDYNGVNCTAGPIDDCAIAPGNTYCSNGACVDGVRSVTCDCSGTDWSGTQCQNNINSCLPTNPCQNGGSCSDGNGVGVYTCDCSAVDYDGTNCQNHINDCAAGDAALCNAGSCVDGLRSHTCNCAGTDRIGVACTDLRDDCASNPCVNGGVCFDGFEDYTCMVPHGYVRLAGDSGASPASTLSCSPVAVGFTNALSVGTWVRFMDLGADPALHTILAYASSNTTHELRLAGNPGGNVTLTVAGEIVEVDTAGLVLGEWAHIAVTWRASDGRWQYYKNGALANNGTGLAVGHAVVSNGCYAVGQSPLNDTCTAFDPNHVFQGDLKDIGVWSAELATAAIEDLANFTHGRPNGAEANLDALWLFDNFEHRKWVGLGANTCDLMWNGVAPRPVMYGGTLKLVHLDSSGQAATSSMSRDTMTAMGTTALSLSSWVRFESGGGGTQTVLSYSAGGNIGEVALHRTGTQFILTINDTPLNLQTLVLSYDTWYHFTVTWDATNGDWAYYRDGAPIATGTAFMAGFTVRDSGCFAVGSMIDSLGCGLYDTAQDLQGDLQDVAVWGKVLNASEADALSVLDGAARPRGDEPDLIALWRSDTYSRSTGSGTWYDRSPNGNDLVWNTTSADGAPTKAGAGQPVYVPECSDGDLDNLWAFPGETDIDCGGYCGACPCDLYTCSNNGVCSNIGGDRAGRRHTCDCSAIDYEGADCETQTDDCSPNPCQNGGSCTDGLNAYTCDCSSVDYSGTNCENHIDDCSPDPCQNGGVCSDGLRSHTCDCSAIDYEGGNCQTGPIDDCAIAPGNTYCSNGACVDGVRSVTCDCSGTDWSGAQCQTNINSCLPTDPCQNGGVCNDGNGVGVYTCDCSAVDYDGATCQNHIDNCSPNPCQAGASCIDANRAFVCDCAGTDKVGATCNQDRNDCLGITCAFGSCIDGFETFTCQVPHGFIRFGAPDGVTSPVMNANAPSAGPAKAAISFAFWVRHIDGAATEQTVFTYTHSSAPNGVQVRATPGGALVWRIGGTETTVATNYGIMREWVHVVLTWRNSDGRWEYYKNGALTNSSTGVEVGTTFTWGGCYAVGGHPTTASCTGLTNERALQGDLKDLHLWEVALNASQVMTMSSFETGRPSGTEAGLINLWLFENHQYNVWEDIGPHSSTLGWNFASPRPRLYGGSRRFMGFDPTGSTGTPSLQKTQAAAGMNANEVSISLWVRLMNTISANDAKHTFLSYAIAGRGGILRVYYDRPNTNLVFSVNGTDMVIQANSTGFVSAIEWVHIAVTWRSSDGRWDYFRDGDLVTSGTGLATGYSIPNGCFAIGTDQTSCGNYRGDLSWSLFGDLQDVAVWNVKLNETAVKFRAHFDGGRPFGDEDDLVSLWRFDSYAGISSAWFDLANRNHLFSNFVAPAPVVEQGAEVVYVPECSNGDLNEWAIFPGETDIDCGGYCGPCPCTTGPCSNGGTCHNIGGNRAGRTWRCDCAAVDYHGDSCQTWTDNCTPEPCQNGGSCTDGLNTFTCSCPASIDYEGTLCQTQIDDCSPDPCLNSGTCNDGLRSSTCSCNGGFTGATCSQVAVTLSSSLSIVTNTSFTVTATFAGSVTGITKAMFSISGFSASTSISRHIYSATSTVVMMRVYVVSGFFAANSVTIRMPAGVYNDGAGTTSLASNTLTIGYDPPVPRFSSSVATAGVWRSNVMTFTASFDSPLQANAPVPVSGVSVATFGVTAGTLVYDAAVAPLGTTSPDSKWVLTLTFLSNLQQRTISLTRVPRGATNVEPRNALGANTYSLSYRPPQATFTSSAGGSNSVVRNLPMTITATFDSAVSGVNAAAFGINSGALGSGNINVAVAPSGASPALVWVATITATGNIVDADVSATMIAWTSTGAGAALNIIPRNRAAVNNGFLLRYRPPVPVLSSGTRPNDSWTSDLTIRFTATFSTAVSGVAKSDFRLDVGSLTSVTSTVAPGGSGATPNTVWVLSVTIADVITSSSFSARSWVKVTMLALSGSISPVNAAANNPGNSFRLSFGPPTVTLSSSAGASPYTTSARQVPVTVVFSSPVSNVSPDDFMLTKSPAGVGTSMTVSPAGGGTAPATSWVVLVNSNSGIRDSDMTLALKTNSQTDISPPPADANNDFTIRFRPCRANLTTDLCHYCNTAETLLPVVTYKVMFSCNVTGLSTSDFRVTSGFTQHSLSLEPLRRTGTGLPVHQVSDYMFRLTVTLTGNFTRSRVIAGLPELAGTPATTGIPADGSHPGSVVTYAPLNIFGEADIDEDGAVTKFRDISSRETTGQKTIEVIVDFMTPTSGVEARNFLIDSGNTKLSYRVVPVDGDGTAANPSRKWKIIMSVDEAQPANAIAVYLKNEGNIQPPPADSTEPVYVVNYQPQPPPPDRHLHWLVMLTICTIVTALCVCGCIYGVSKYLASKAAKTTTPAKYSS